jgi:Cu-Zn family superoxide dismutase
MFTQVIKLALALTAIFWIGGGESLKAAVCKIERRSGVGTVHGCIYLAQPTSKHEVTINIDLHSLNSRSKHGFHVHAIGNLTAKCANAGPHFNPFNTSHGSRCAPVNERHAGDLGNIETDRYGNSTMQFSDRIISLYPNYRTNIIGKAIVVHELQDDLGRGGAATSNTTGNAGQRLGCCIIKLISPEC